VLAGAKDFYVRQRAIDVLLERQVRPKDYLGEIKALFEWVQHNVRYTKDTFRVEVLHSARRMLELRAGDCDDMAILLGSMLEAIGHPVRLVVVGPDAVRPSLFTHIYIEANLRGRWIPLDATMPHPMGWAPRAFVKRVFTLGRSPDMISEDELQGLGAPVTVPDWLRGLIRSIRREGMRPKDERVRSLWNLLRQRQLLARSPQLQRALRFAWNSGLAKRPRPRTTRRMVGLLRRWGILPPLPARAAIARRVGARPFRVAARVPYRPIRPVGARGYRSMVARRARTGLRG
jgi:hypothetical protein